MTDSPTQKTSGITEPLGDSLLSRVLDVSPSNAVLAEHLEDLCALQALMAHLARHPDELQTYLDTQRAGLLWFAVTTCPYYRERFQSFPWPETFNATPDEIRSLLSHFTRLPLLGKREVQQSLKEIWSEEAVDEPVHFWRTSGSTGAPARFIVDEFNALARDASFWFIQHLLGRDTIAAEPGETLMVRISSSEGPAVWKKSLPLYHSAMLWKLPVFHHPAAPTLTEVVAFLKQEQPRLLAGDPQGFYMLMDQWKTSHPEASHYPYPLLSLTCGGNQLSPEARNAIEDFFQHPVTDCYGLTETSIIASQCRHGTFHIHLPVNFVEILDPQGHPLSDGEAGEIVVTHLLNWAFPFIRYQTGDIGRMRSNHDCPCGCPLPELYDFQGRKRRFLLKADGSLLPPQRLLSIFAPLPLYQYQLIQEEPCRFLLRYVPTAPLTDEMRDGIRAQLDNYVGAVVAVGFEEHPETLEEPGVKFQDFICKCHQSAV